MKKLFKNTLILLLASIVVFSCQQKEALITNSQVSPKSLFKGVSVENGMVVFETEETFNEIVEFIYNNEVNKTHVDFNQLFPNFESSYEAYEALTEDNIVAENGDMSKFASYAFFFEGMDGEKYLQPVIDSKIFGNISNKDGVYKIGDKIVKTTYENDFIMNASQYFEGITNKQIESISEKHSIDRNIIDLDSNNTFDKAQTHGYCSKVYEWKGRKNKQYRKMTATFISRFRHIGGHSECRVITTNYKRGSFGGWYKNEANTIRHYGSVDLQVWDIELTPNGWAEGWGTPFTVDFDTQRTEVKEIDELLGEMTQINTLRYDPQGSHEGTHRVRKYGGGNWAQCTISF